MGKGSGNCERDAVMISPNEDFTPLTMQEMVWYCEWTITAGDHQFRIYQYPETKHCLIRSHYITVIENGISYLEEIYSSHDELSADEAAEAGLITLIYGHDFATLKELEVAIETTLGESTKRTLAVSYYIGTRDDIQVFISRQKGADGERSWIWHYSIGDTNITPMGPTVIAPTRAAALAAVNAALAQHYQSV